MMAPLNPPDLIAVEIKREIEKTLAVWEDLGVLPRTVADSMGLRPSFMFAKKRQIKLAMTKWYSEWNLIPQPGRISDDK